MALCDKVTLDLIKALDIYLSTDAKGDKVQLLRAYAKWGADRKASELMRNIEDVSEEEIVLGKTIIDRIIWD